MKPVSKSNAVATYAELLKRVRETLILGRERIEQEKGALDIVLKFE